MLRNREYLELLLGAVMVVLAVLFAWHANNYMQASSYLVYDADQQYRLKGVFQSVPASLEHGADVYMLGMQVGRLLSKKLVKPSNDGGIYTMQLTIYIDKDIEIPQDSLLTFGNKILLGPSHIVLKPGRSGVYLKDMQEIINTDVGMSGMSEILTGLMTSIT